MNRFLVRNLIAAENAIKEDCRSLKAAAESLAEKLELSDEEFANPENAFDFGYGVSYLNTVAESLGVSTATFNFAVGGFPYEINRDNARLGLNRVVKELGIKYAYLDEN